MTSAPAGPRADLEAAGKRLQSLRAELEELEGRVGALVRAAAEEVTPTEAARMTGLSRPTIYKMLRGERSGRVY